MKERPIIFSESMVRAILDERKTMTRRVIKPQPGNVNHYEKGFVNEAWQSGFVPVKCPYGVPGDLLWVREWHKFESDELGKWIKYVDNFRLSFRGDEISVANANPEFMWNRCRPAIFLPRWASRITLEIVDVRVERLQEISEEDVKAEGVPLGECSDDLPCHAQGFIELWESINFKRGFGWELNPWVWVIEFKRIKP